MLTDKQLAEIPRHLMERNGKQGARHLIAWLNARGWRMTLAELENERRACGIH